MTMGHAGEDAFVFDPDAIARGTDPLGIGTGEAPPGTYTLVFGVDSVATATVGALGSVTLPAGGYAYVGSAFGSSGLGRVDRHRRVADGSHGVRHWHVDYLGGHPAATLDAVVAAPRDDVECRLATELRATVSAADPDATSVPTGFGASDCDCPAHLVAGADPDSLQAAAVDALGTVAPSRG